MIYRIAADAVVVVHAGFVAFVVLGGLLAYRWPRAVRVHLPAAIYGAAVEIGGWTCPLTPLENALRRRGGEGTYAGSFVEQHLVPLLYPGPLPGWGRWALAGVVVVVNAAVYGMLRARSGRR